MSASKVNQRDAKKPATMGTNLLAGGAAGMVEAMICHPLDTIKVRMQLSQRGLIPGVPKMGFVGTGANIVKSESFGALYKGLGAVTTGIIPKMATRFTSFEAYKRVLSDKATGKVSSQATFLAGLAAGVTEAVVVVTPMEVIKIRLQAQASPAAALANPGTAPQYRNATHALTTIVQVEGLGALYRGISLTALRQGTNQAVNFTAYSKFKTWLQQAQPRYADTTLPSYQITFIGLVSGAMGPLCNAPIDVIKTRLQKAPQQPGVSGFSRIMSISSNMFRQDGLHAFYKGITPRIMRVAPGQAITFTVYEFVRETLESKTSLLPVPLAGRREVEAARL